MNQEKINHESYNKNDCKEDRNMYDNCNESLNNCYELACNFEVKCNNQEQLFIDQQKRFSDQQEQFLRQERLITHQLKKISDTNLRNVVHKNFFDGQRIRFLHDQQKFVNDKKRFEQGLCHSREVMKMYIRDLQVALQRHYQQ